MRLLVAPVCVFLLLLSGLGLSEPSPPARPRRGPASMPGYAVLETRDSAVVSAPVPVPVDSYGGRFLRWSPDGRYLVYNTGAELYLYDAWEAEPRNLTATPDRWELMPSWAPDGERLAFTTRRLEPREGKPLEPEGYPWVTMAGCFCGNPAVVRRDGSGYRILEKVDVLNPPSWSPDGETVAYDGGGALHLFHLKTGQAKVIRPGDVGLGARYLGAPAWSPRRAELAFFFAEDDRAPSREELLGGRAARPRQGYALLDVKTGQVRVLHQYAPPFVPRSPAAWSASGERLALSFGCALIICDPLGLVVVDRRGERAEKVAAEPYQAIWEPGGERLAYIDNRDRRMVHVLTPTSGGWQRQVIEHGYPVEGIAWRPG